MATLNWSDYRPNRNKGIGGKFRVYLAGPIQDMTDSQAKDWRVSAKNLFSLSGVDFEVIDPMDRDYRGNELDNFEEIVVQDKADIMSCDYVLANVHAPSAGTSMEIYLAWTHRIDVVVALSHRTLSPWVKYHSKVVMYDVDMAVAYIIGDAIKEKQLQETVWEGIPLNTLYVHSEEK